MQEEQSIARPCGPLKAWLSGFVAGAVVVIIGILAAPAPANQLAIPRPGIEPVCIYLAAALAAAVPAWQQRASLGLTAAFALGAAIFTFFISGWIGHWMNVGVAVRRTGLLAQAVWRRDLGVAALAVFVWPSVTTFLGKE